MNSFSSQRTETTAPSSLTVQLTAEELGKNGSCIAWTEVSGKTVRVILPGTLPGDAVEAVVELPKKGAHSAIGRVSRFIRKSPGRRGSPCPASALCGGCPLIELTSEAQLSYKKRFLEKLFSATPGGASQILDPIPMPHGIDSGYRNKAVLYFEESAGTRKLGMYEAGSHHVAPGTDSCRLCPHWMAVAANAVLRWSRDSGLSVWSETSQTGLLRGLILRAGSNGRLATLVTSSYIPDSASESLISALQSAGVSDITVSIKTRPGNFVLGETSVVLLGRGSVTAEISGLEFEVRPETFLQVNTPQTPVLYDTAIRLASISPEDTVLDLYSGIGTISLLLARKAGHVIGVEIVPESVEEAKKNAVRNGLSNTEFFCGPAEKILPDICSRGIQPKTVFVDPPRKGLEASVPGIIAAMEPETVIYIACGPEALARDAAKFHNLGYCLDTLQPVDLFPDTAHIECVARLRRVQ